MSSASPRSMRFLRVRRYFSDSRNSRANCSMARRFLVLVPATRPRGFPDRPFLNIANPLFLANGPGQSVLTGALLLRRFHCSPLLDLGGVVLELLQPLGGIWTRRQVQQPALHPLGPATLLADPRLHDGDDLLRLER